MTIAFIAAPICALPARPPRRSGVERRGSLAFGVCATSLSGYAINSVETNFQLLRRREMSRCANSGRRGLLDHLVGRPAKVPRKFETGRVRFVAANGSQAQRE